MGFLFFIFFVNFHNLVRIKNEGRKCKKGFSLRKNGPKLSHHEGKKCEITF